jgi:hypothetical protein
MLALAQESQPKVVVIEQGSEGNVKTLGPPPGGAFKFNPGSFKMPPPPGVSQDTLSLLEMKEVQKELQFNDDNLAELALLKKELEDGDKEFSESIKGLPFQEWGPKFNERRKEVEKLIKEVLGEEKWQRYRQVRWQLDGIGMAVLMHKEVQEALGIDKEQLQKFSEAARPKFDAKSFQPPKFDGPPDPAKIQEYVAKSMENAAKERNEKILALLTSEQKSKWDQLVGKKIDFKRPPPKMPTMMGMPGGMKGTIQLGAPDGKPLPPPPADGVAVPVPNYKERPPEHQ